MKSPYQFSKALLSGRRKRTLGFSLVEVVMAVGIASFCLIGMLGLLPVGITSDRGTLEQTSAAGLAQAVAGDMHTISAGAAATQTPRFAIPIPGAGAASIPNKTLYFAEDCTTIVSTPAAARYRVDVIFGAAVKSSANTSYGQYAPRPVRVLVTWPVPTGVSVWPTSAAGAFETLTTTGINTAPSLAPQ